MAEPQGNPRDRNRRHRKRRGFGFWLLMGLALLVLIVVVLVLLAPVIVSTESGTRLAVSAINERIKGTVFLADISMSWGGPTHLRSLRVVDAQGRQVLSAQDVSYSGGVWRLLTQAENFEQVSVDRPVAILYLDEDNQPSLVEALEPKEPGRPGPPREFRLKTQPRRLAINEGLVRVVRQGQSYEMMHLNVNANVESLQQMQGQLRMTSPEGVVLSMDGEVKDMFSDKGDLQPGQATMVASIASSGPLDLAPLFAVLAPTSNFGGSARFDIRADVKEGKGTGKIDAAFAGLRAGNRQNIEPVDLTLNGLLNFGQTQVDGRMDLQGDMGRANLEYVYPLQGWERRNGDAASLFLRGKSVEMPAFSLNGSAEFDIPRLERAIGGLLNIRQDVTLSGGRLSVPNLSARGGPEPSARMSLRFQDLRGQGPRGAVTVEPITVDLDAALQEGVGINVRRAVVESAFLNFQAQGSPNDLKANYQANLQRMMEQLLQLFDLPDFSLAGVVSGDAQLRRENQDISIQATMQATDVRYERGQQQVQVSAAGFTHDGKFEFNENDSWRYVLRQSRLTAAGGEAVDLTAQGLYEQASGAFDFQANVRQLRIQEVAQFISPDISGPLRRFAGSVTATLNASRDANDAPIVASVESEIGRQQPLTVDGNLLGGSDRPINISIKSARIGPEEMQVSLPQLLVSAAFLSLTGRDIEIQNGENTIARGRVELQADLAPVMAAAALLTQNADMPEISGRLAGSSTFQTQENVVVAQGEWGLENFVMRREGQTFQDPKVDLKYDMQADTRRKSVEVKSFSIASLPLRLQAKGTVAEYDTRQLMDMEVSYVGSWERIIAMLHQLYPETAQTVLVQGQPEDTFKIIGPANQPDVVPSYRGLRMQPSVDWTAAELYGLEMERAELSPQLADGKLVIPPATLPGKAGGSVNVGGEVDLTTQVKIYRLGGQVQVLDKFQVTPEVGRHILSRFNPIFAQAARMEGRVSLQTTDLVLPLGEDIKRGGSGSGRLDLSEMQVEPSGIFGELMRLAGSSGRGTERIEVSPLNFVISNGRISYENFIITIGGTDMRFRGSVGFDDSLDMTISLPVSQELLRQLRAPGLPPDMAERLKNMRVEIRLRGNRMTPRLDFSSIDVRKLLGEALTGGGLLRPPEPTTRGETRPSRDPVRDVRDILERFDRGGGNSP